VDQISASTTPAEAPAAAAGASDAVTPTPEQGPAADTTDPGTDSPGFRSRGSARRRARFLRKARELAYRDLGGLIFNLHRFGARNDTLVLAKLTTLAHIDDELRALEDALRERRPISVLREAGITACARCAAIHSSQDSFCPNCGLAISRHVDLPADLRSAGAPPVPANATTSTPPSPAPTSEPEQSTAASLAQEPPRPPLPAPGTQPAASPPSHDEPTEILRPHGSGA
jgi:hypothetical protein